MSWAAWSKAWVCGGLLVGIVGSNPARGMDTCLLCVASYQVEVSAQGCSFVQRSTTDCVVPECDREASKMRGPKPTMVVYAMETNSDLFGALPPPPITG